MMRILCVAIACSATFVTVLRRRLLRRSPLRCAVAVSLAVPRAARTQICGFYSSVQMFRKQ